MIDKIYEVISDPTHKEAKNLLTKEVVTLVYDCVMIWDVLDWFEWTTNVIYFYEWHLWAEIAWDILSKRKDKRKPIEDQSEECIKYVYDLATNQ